MRKIEKTCLNVWLFRKKAVPLRSQMKEEGLKVAPDVTLNSINFIDGGIAQLVRASDS